MSKTNEMSIECCDDGSFLSYEKKEANAFNGSAADGNFLYYLIVFKVNDYSGNWKLFLVRIDMQVV